MVCLGLKPMMAGWKAQTNPLCYGGTPFTVNSFSLILLLGLNLDHLKIAKKIWSLVVALLPQESPPTPKSQGSK